VNYYIKHLMVDANGNFSKTIEWITDNGDPKLVTHPVLAMVTDIVWSRIAFRTFLYGKSWLLLTLVVFILGTAVLKDRGDSGRLSSQYDRDAVFCCRCFIYICSMGRLIYSHVRQGIQHYRSEDVELVFRVPVPSYLMRWQGQTSLLLTVVLFLMFTTEPIIRCFNHSDYGLFTVSCPHAAGPRFVYSVFSMVAMVLYFLLLIDLSVFSTYFSAFVLICFRVLAELALFLVGLAFFILTFACAVSTLQQDHPAYDGIQTSALTLLKITFGMVGAEHYQEIHGDVPLLCAVLAYIMVTVIFLLNLLIAQLSCSYITTYQDMLGFARLQRGKIVVEAMPSVASWRWESFVASLKLNQRIEFLEGDVGLAGGVQVLEQANANITTVDMIRRFGGSTCPEAQWPKDVDKEDEEDRFHRMERLIEKAVKRMGAGSKGRRGSGAGGSSLGMSRDGSSLSGPTLGASGASSTSGSGLSGDGE